VSDDCLSPQEEIAAKRELLALLEEKAARRRAEIEREAWLAERARCRTDLFYLLTEVLGRPDLKRPWLQARCEEVQADPDGYLDLWAREHYKSTIITFGKTIQDILATHGDGAVGQEVTIGIFSHTRPIAKAFLRQIKGELERNERLRLLFPDILYENPQKNSPKWSEDEGITVKRASNPKEGTLEAWGLVDGQPTSKHFRVLVYDDVVTKDSVTTPDMIAKTTAAIELSYNLGAEGGAKRFIGTRYHYNDTYRTVMERGTAKARTYAATVDGSPTGTPVLLSVETLAAKRRDMGPYTFACQMLQDPKGDETQGFREEWLRYWGGGDGQGMNTYILVDPASSKKPGSDYTVMWVVGLGGDRNYYVLDIVRDRLNLTQRCERLFGLHRKWRPVEVRYERYGMQADIQHIEAEQERVKYRFKITEVAGQTAKPDRIKRLIPLFEQGRIFLPMSHWATDYEGKTSDLVSVFKEEEYKAFPVPMHDDMLDGLARIEEPELTLAWPMEVSTMGAVAAIGHDDPIFG
jgi:predicted phage terminase large subunit-like protein